MAWQCIVRTQPRDASAGPAGPASLKPSRADCAPGGDPLLAWTELKNQRWTIVASNRKSGKFQPSVTISDPAHRAINPVVLSSGPRTYNVAWEEYGQGKFAIWMARYANDRWSRPTEVTA